jgi:hypothetical protein
LIVELKEALSEEKAARLAVDWALAEEKAARQTVEQSLLSSNEANTVMANGLDSTRALDHSVIQKQQMKIRLEACEEKLTACEERLTVANDKLKATKEKMKTQEQLLDLAQQALSKRELSYSMVISSVVANAVALMKNHLPNLNMEILHKDFTVDDAERETLVNSAYDAAHDFVSLNDFSSLAESDDNNNLEAL